MKPIVSTQRIPTLEELGAQITEANCYEETDCEPEREKEAVEW